jgi:hypothetical protein
MHQVLAFVKANYAAILIIAGIWSAIATALNKSKWPRPPVGSPKWKIVLHAILIDGPAFLPSIDMKGMFGAPFNVPFITLSNHPAPPAETLDMQDAIAKIRAAGGFASVAILPVLMLLGALALLCSGCDWQPLDAPAHPLVALLVCSVLALAGGSLVARRFRSPLVLVLCLCITVPGIPACSWSTQQWKDFGSKVLAQGGACAVKVATDEAGKVANGILDAIDSAIAKGQSPTDWAALGETAAIDAGTCIGADLLDDYLTSKTAGPASPPKCKRGGRHRAPEPQHEAYLRALLRVR